MKTIITMIALCLPMFAIAGENCSTQSSEEQVTEQMEIKTDVPKFLEGATVCVKLANGKETCVPAEKFKVVARKQQFIITKTSQKDVTTCSPEKQRNRLSVLAGNGPKEGLNRTNNGSTVTIESRTGVVGGIQYQYETDLKVFDLPLSVGGQLQSNESGLLGVGLDF